MTIESLLPVHQDLYYGGAWHPPKEGQYIESRDPATGRMLGTVALGDPADMEAVIAAARAGFETWRAVPPMERARILREIAAVIRRNGDALALLDSADGGNPVKEMARDVETAAASFEFFAGLVTEMKGDSIPMGPSSVNFTTREPLGVVARIVAFNHPFMFTAAKAAAPLAAGNSVIMKPPEVASLSALRLAELIGHLLPPGVFNIATGARDAGATLASHPGIAMVTLIGSVPTGRAVMRAAADTLKPVLLELGGKNALIAFPDADPDEVAKAMVAGMNFGWCGQSCGSTSRAFVHDDLYAAVLDRLKEHIAPFRPGIPTDPATTMGAIVSEPQHQRVLRYIDIAKEDGARLFHGGRRPEDPALAKGFFVEPTVFADVTQTMRIAREEVFGPILSVLRWRDEAAMLADVNSVEYGLTCSIWTNDLNAAHRTGQRVEAGYVWVNETGKHFLGAPFGGFKQSGIGREECLGELLSFTREKNIHIRLRA
ncbi:aldehyde dehydrogenase family protein [Azospirillum sp. TSO35-2]|uniref:aldehyde dehydrogenase family protein n=1 Tax=Azospirillum sp. TSO35-2 TaxID=716796 RepID=UPI001FFF8953|nr:aldehyde dehydrogenase family protein [Azospirillum sp. TSO35-2]